MDNSLKMSFGTASVTFGRLLVSPINKTDRHDMAEILVKVALNIITIFTNLHRLSTGTYTDVKTKCLFHRL